MKTLIVGVGALGGIIAARLLAAGSPVWLATRNSESAAKLKASRLRVSGVGGDVSTEASNVATLDEYSGDIFDLIVLATKAQDAIEIAPRLFGLLTPDGTLLPIQNGGVAQMLSDMSGNNCVLGGLSNMGATMTAVGAYEQRNAGHLLIGELVGCESERAERIRQWLSRAVEVRILSNIRGAVWSKLLLNCSVTTIGAIAGCTMREYITTPDGRELFDRIYDEALSVALASGARPEQMIVAPIPPNRSGRDATPCTYDAWLDLILKSYGDLKPSMLQDFERGRTTEIDFINGYVAALGKRIGVATPANAAVVESVHAIERGRASPSPTLLGRILIASAKPVPSPQDS